MWTIVLPLRVAFYSTLSKTLAHTRSIPTDQIAHGALHTRSVFNIQVMMSVSCMSTEMMHIYVAMIRSMELMTTPIPDNCRCKEPRLSPGRLCRCKMCNSFLGLPLKPSRRLLWQWYLRWCVLLRADQAHAHSCWYGTINGTHDSSTSSTYQCKEPRWLSSRFWCYKKCSSS